MTTPEISRPVGHQGSGAQGAVGERGIVWMLVGLEGLAERQALDFDRELAERGEAVVAFAEAGVGGAVRVCMVAVLSRVPHRPVRLMTQGHGTVETG